MYTPFPDFITNAKRELMLSAVFLDFFAGAIVEGRCVLFLMVVVVSQTKENSIVRDLRSPNRASGLFALQGCFKRPFSP